MPIQKLILLIINIGGGGAVLGSYIIGLAGKTNGSAALWGGTPANVKPFYSASMLLAALSYFVFLYFIFFKLSPEVVNFNILYLIFIGILLPSILWMPLTNLYVTAPGAGVWLGIRLVLILVGLFSIALTWFLMRLGGSGTAYGLAVGGSVYLAFHTLVLDAILWPVFFKLT